MSVFLRQGLVADRQMYEYTKCHRTSYFKRVNFMVCELCYKVSIKLLFKKADLPLIFAGAQMETHMPYA